MDYSELDIDYKKLGQRIKSQRINKQWTQEKTAITSGLSLNYYQRIESNNAKLSLVALVRVAYSTIAEALISNSPFD